MLFIGKPMGTSIMISNDIGETPSATPTNSRRNLQADDTTSTNKRTAELNSREGPRRAYSYRAPLRGRGPCEVSLHLQPNLVEEVDG